jgi:2-polyprenyl-3-methyl-5-hydroxy-6-metoxy-1,4-benzoquinol methylase
MWIDKEFVNPFDKDDKDFWIKIEHIGRYLYAADIIKKRCGHSSIVADMGCAVGYGTKLLAGVSQKITGFDINSEYLNIAKQENMAPNIDYKFLDIQSSCEENIFGLFDCIISFEVFEHIDEINTGLILFNKIMTNGGLLICSIPNDKYEARNEEGNPSNKFHKRIYTKNQIITSLNKAGFRIEEILGQYMPNVLAKKELKMTRKQKKPMLTTTEPIFRDIKFIEYFGNLLGYPTNDNIENSYSYIYLAQKM